MEHVDPELLALIALGEPADDEARAHLDACPPCTEEVAALAATVGTARALTPADTLVAPAPAVWDRIRTELALPGDLHPDTVDRAARARAELRAEPTTVAAGAPASDAPATDPAGPRADDDERSATVVPLRRRRGPWIASAAAAGLVIGAAGGAIMATQASDTTAPVVASAPLEPLPGWSATGQAVVHTLPGGGRELAISLAGTAEQEGFREVWLIDRDVTRLVSLGVLEGSEGRFTVPDGLDLTDFAVVDVSDEPFDGDPTHSGDSIIRGVLDT